jgi:ribosomal protein S27E
MRRYEDVKVEESKLVEVKCDLCGRLLQNPEGGTDHFVQPNWSKADWGVDEVVIKRTHGESYPEEAFVEVDCIDLCPTCFTEKLIPWLESQKAEEGTS